MLKVVIISSPWDLRSNYLKECCEILNLLGHKCEFKLITDVNVQELLVRYCVNSDGKIALPIILIYKNSTLVKTLKIDNFTCSDVLNLFNS